MKVAAWHAWWLVAVWRPVSTPMGWLRHSSVCPFAVRVAIRSWPGFWLISPVKLGVTPAVGQHNSPPQYIGYSCR